MEFTFLFVASIILFKETSGMFMESIILIMEPALPHQESNLLH
jgi:hypothetical protein